VPPAIRDVILGSLGGALQVAVRIPGPTGAALADAARRSFVSGMDLGLLIAAIVVAAAAALVLLALPQRPPPPGTSTQARGRMASRRKPTSRHQAASLRLALGRADSSGRRGRGKVSGDAVTASRSPARKKAPAASRYALTRVTRPGARWLRRSGM